jgi:hypothetical protein
MVDIKQLLNVLNSEIYQRTIDFIKSRMNVVIDGNYDTFFAEIDSEQLLKANVSIEEMRNIINTDLDKVVAFAIAKIEKFDKESDDGGEFPKEEGLDEDELPVNVAPSKYVLSFLLMYAVEYYLLKNNPDKLLQYIKYQRIPNAKKYEQELKEIYENLSND